MTGENTQQINCEFSEPVYWDEKELILKSADNTLKSLENWNFSKINCSGSGSSTDQIFEVIENSETGSSFFLSRELTYGDILITFFLMIFLVFGIWNFFFKLMIPKIVKIFNRSD
jgi:hypothetical protein